MLVSLFKTSGKLAPMLSGVPTRLLSGSNILQLTQSPVFCAPSSANIQKLKQLRSTLKKEKEVYKKIKEKLAKERTKVAEKKKKEKLKAAQAKEKAKAQKLIQQAFKTPKKLSPFNMYLKEHGKDGVAVASKAWVELSDFEKDEFQDKADDYNEELASIYKPKPKAPSAGFAKFISENFSSRTGANSEIIKELAGEWNNLAVDEKARYAKNESEWSQYQKDLQAWKQDRIQLFNKKHGTNLSL